MGWWICSVVVCQVFRGLREPCTRRQKKRHKKSVKVQTIVAKESSTDVLVDTLVVQCINKQTMHNASDLKTDKMTLQQA